jgi:hypothetical protein
MEDLRELQWIWTVVDLDDDDDDDDDERAWPNDEVAPVIAFVTTYHEQASHAYDERRSSRGRGLRVARSHLVLHLLEG